MLTYLDALIEALSVRDSVEVERLLAHPLARILPAPARAEAELINRGAEDPLAAPLRIMQLRHQTAELLREVPIVADREEEVEPEVLPGILSQPTGTSRRTQRPPRRGSRRTGRIVQMELPLSA